MMIFSTCTSTEKGKKSHVETMPLSKDNFMSRPFGYEPNIKNFSGYLPSSYKQQIYTKKNKHYPNITDSIFRFYYKKNELFVYKTNSNREMFVAGNIYDRRIVLHNGIKVGMNRSDFFKCFKDLTVNTRDTLRMTSKPAGNSYNFIFKQDKLKAIKIDNYID
jgi:hypothetical protein